LFLIRDVDNGLTEYTFAFEKCPTTTQIPTYKTFITIHLHLDDMERYTSHQHDLAVQKLAEEVARFHAAQVPFRINHGSTNSTRRRDPATPQLHIAHLNNIIDIDTEKQLAIVEPNVPLDHLVSNTLQKGLMPLVVMEFPGITVGGGFSGASGESTGWKEGLFDCSIEEVEIVLGNGEVVLAAQEGRNSDLFDAARCTLGTMGVVTLLKVRLTRAGDAVQLVYHHTTSVSETIHRLATLCEESKTPEEFDFIEALQYSMEKGVIITGRRVSSASATVHQVPRQRFDRATDPWFYMHAKNTLNGYTELTPTQSYLFRHDRGAFWSGEVFLKYYGLPNIQFVRWLLNPFMTARAIYKAMLATDSADAAIVQDLLLPLETSEAFVDYIATELGIWPLWICPIRKKATAERIVGWPFYEAEGEGRAAVGQSLNKGNVSWSKEELTLNFGVWGPTDPTPSAVRKTNRALEQKLRDLRGMKVPYAANFYSENEFWDLYDRKKYEHLRKKWHAEALPTMYDKVHRNQTFHEVEAEGYTEAKHGMNWKEKMLHTWPLGGLYQMFNVLFK
jgi:delta24-sterol reductase